MKIRTTILCSCLLFFSCCALAQGDNDSATISSKYIAAVDKKAEQLSVKLDRKTAKTVAAFQRQEQKLYRKLLRTDSVKAKAVFADAQGKYAQLEQRLAAKQDLKQYIPGLDSMSSSLKFLQGQPQLLSCKLPSDQLSGAMAKVDELKSQFAKAEQVQQFLRERKAYLKQQLQGLAFAKQFKQLNKQAYYYSAQVQEYKALLKDQKKIEQKALQLLSQSKLFKDFMRKNSQLASLFRLPGGPNDPVANAGLAGLQTRAQVSSLIQQQLGTPAAQAQFRQNMQQAQSQLNELKEKVMKNGGGSSDMEMPEDFKINPHKTRGFWKRLQAGSNMQSQRGNGLLPVTSDIGLSLGYKLNDKSIIGIGMSYKLGWGESIRKISITHQGIGLRSFIDWKIKGSFWLTGGYELNYRAAFRDIDVLKDLNAWQPSGLIGVSKLLSVNMKYLKQTKLQLLWDFLSYEQVPRTQPINFRIGYNF